MHVVDVKLTVNIFRAEAGHTAVSRTVEIDLEASPGVYTSDHHAVQAAVQAAREQVLAMLSPVARAG